MFIAWLLCSILNSAMVVIYCRISYLKDGRFELSIKDVTLILLICFLPILNYIVLLFIFLIAMACAYEEAEIRTDKWLNKKILNKALLKWDKCEEDKLEQE